MAEGERLEPPQGLAARVDVKLLKPWGLSMVLAQF